MRMPCTRASHDAITVKSFQVPTRRGKHNVKTIRIDFGVTNLPIGFTLKLL